MTPEKNKKKTTFVPHSVRVSMGWFFRCASDGREKMECEGHFVGKLGGDLGVVRRGGWWFRAFP